MKRTAFIITVSSAALALTTLTAFANTRGPDFAELDADGNGMLTLEEMQANAQGRFDDADADGDGFLSQAELEEIGKSRAADRAAHMMSRMDEDGDGKLSMEEMSRRHNPDRFFDRMDADNDGSISEEEFKQAQAKMNKRGKHRKHKN